MIAKARNSFSLRVLPFSNTPYTMLGNNSFARRGIKGVIFFLDDLDKLREDVQYRREVTNKIGLGFEISAQTPDVVPNVPSLDLAVA